MSRLISSQINACNNATLICRRCFTNYRNSPQGEILLSEHRKKCNLNHPVTPIMPDPNTFMKFKNFTNTVRHPIIIYADFECILKKSDQNDNRDKTTKIISDHIPMSYCYYVKPNEDISIELMKKFNIPTEPVLFRGVSQDDNIAKRFLEEIVSVAHKISDMFQTNITMIRTHEDQVNHLSTVRSGKCNMCKQQFKTTNPPVKDHDHLTGKYRQTICNNCNLLLRMPKFVPCIFHNLSNYDGHFITTELEYDVQSIKVIPNTEEKFISFSKYIKKILRSDLSIVCGLWRLV